MNVKQINPDVDVQELQDEQILMTHAALHSYHREIEEMEREIEDWSIDDVTRVHQEVVDEMDERGLPHQEMTDLDEQVEQSMSPEVEWAEQFAEADNPSEFVQSNPPEADWYVEAIEAVDEIDQSLDLREYVTLSTADYEELDDVAQEWVDEHDISGSLVGYEYYDQEDELIALVKEAESFSVHQSSECVFESEMPDKAYSEYEQLSGAMAVDDESKDPEEETNELVQSRHKRNEYGNSNRDTRWVHTIEQQGFGNQVVVAEAVSKREDFWISIHTSGTQYEQSEGPGFSDAHATLGPIPTGDRVIPTAIMLDEEATLANGERFFVALRHDDDGSVGEMITDDDGEFIFDAATYWHHMVESESEDTEETEQKIDKLLDRTEQIIEQSEDVDLSEEQERNY